MFRVAFVTALWVILATLVPVRSETITANFDDLNQVPAAKKLIDDAAAKLRPYAQGNESSVAVKSATGKGIVLDLDSKMPVAGLVTLVFDLHHRHRTLPDGWIIVDTPFGQIKTKRPGIVAYDRHQELYVEYDIKEGKGKARLAKGPVNLPLIPQINWDLWVHFNAK